MKKLLLGMSIGTMLAVSPAQAQLAVIDNSNLVAQAKNLLQELKSYATQLQQLQQEIQQVTWLATTARVHDPEPEPRFCHGSHGAAWPNQ